MARMILGPSDTQSNYRGLASIFEYRNEDGRLNRWNCGQAAAATFVTQVGKLPIPENASAQLQELEREHPPDQLAGWLGTGRRRVERICRSYGAPVHEVHGEEALRDSLVIGRPVMVMLGIPAGRCLSFDWPGGHWTVAYGFDDERVYLSNYGTMAWEEFRQRWRSWIAWWIRMDERGLTV